MRRIALFPLIPLVFLSCQDPAEPVELLEVEPPQFQLSGGEWLRLVVDDPVGDHTGIIDVTLMVMIFNQSTGEYKIRLTTSHAHPFTGDFRININLFNQDVGTTARNPSFFQDVLNDFSLAVRKRRIELGGNDSRLRQWDIGDRVFTNSLTGTGNPDGASLFRTSVTDLPGGFLDSEDFIAFAETGRPAIIEHHVSLPIMTREIVVLNDINLFDNTAMENENNQQFVTNLVEFDEPGSRADGTVIWWDNGRGSFCGASCALSAMTTMASQITDVSGFQIDEINSSSGSLVDVPTDVKVIFLWNPAEPFVVDEINALKEFASEGGRIVFIGEHEAFYPSDAVENVLNPFLADMGSEMTNVGGLIDCGRQIVPQSSLRYDHQITDNVNELAMGCASEVLPGADDIALFYDQTNTIVLAGVAKVTTDPITALALAQADAGELLSTTSGNARSEELDPLGHRK